MTLVCYTSNGADRPGVGELGVVEEFFVGEGLEEGFEVGALLWGQWEAGDELGFVGVFAAVAGVGAGGDDAAAVGVVVEDVVQSAEAAIVHVGGADGYVAQRRRAEFPDVLRRVGVVVEA